MKDLLETVDYFDMETTIGYDPFFTAPFQNNLNQLRNITVNNSIEATAINIRQDDISGWSTIWTFFIRLEELIRRNVRKSETKVPNIINYIRYGNCYECMLRIQEYPNYHGMIGNITKSSPYNDFSNLLKENGYEVEHLEGLETLFEQENKIIRVFTIKGYRMLLFEAKYTPTIKDIARLKIIQWNLFKTDDYDPLIGEMYDALKNTDRTALNNVIETVNKFNIITKLREIRLNQIFKIDYDAKIQELKSSIYNNYSTIEDYKRNALNLINKIKRLQEEIKITELQQKNEEGNEFLTEMLLNNNYITDIEAEDRRTINIEYKAPLIYYDPLAIEEIIDSYTDDNYIILQAFLKAEYELIAKAKVRFDKQDFTTAALRVNREHDSIPHPHIDRWGCLGNHDEAIYESAESGDYIGAIDQITQAILNLNFYDGTVINEMLDKLTYDYADYECWRHKETGEKISTNTLIERMIENEKTDDNE